MITKIFIRQYEGIGMLSIDIAGIYLGGRLGSYGYWDMDKTSKCIRNL